MTDNMNFFCHLEIWVYPFFTHAGWPPTPQMSDRHKPLFCVCRISCLMLLMQPLRLFWTETRMRATSAQFHLQLKWKTRTATGKGCGALINYWESVSIKSESVECPLTVRVSGFMLGGQVGRREHKNRSNKSKKQKNKNKPQNQRRGENPSQRHRATCQCKDEPSRVTTLHG